MNPEHEGGAASHSTDPTPRATPRGSPATDVLAETVRALDRHLTHEIAALRRETTQANRNAERAIEVAAAEAKERLAAHNGLIQKMEDQAEHFATRGTLDDFKAAFNERKDVTDGRFNRIEKFQYMLTGAILLLSFIGFANLVKVWAG
jgi:DNA-binding protein H-NS